MHVRGSMGMAGMGAALRGLSQDSVLEMVRARQCRQDGPGGGDSVGGGAGDSHLERAISRL